jgi:hypothetical protein
MNIETIETTSSATKQLSQCKNFMTDISTNTLKTSTSCENYLEVINLAADESCAFNIEAVNPEDPGNQITIFKQMPGYKPPYGDITSDTEVASAAEAYGAIPKDAIDLIDFDGVELVNFNTAQESHLKNGLALWLAQSPATYRDYFDNHINKMTYVGTEDICNGGNVLAFAPFNSTEFFWCESSNFSEAALDVDIGGPSAAVNIAVTAFHEVLHTHSYDHDFARQDYKSCEEGTSRSAVVMLNLILCKESYCQNLKDFAESEYRYELEYSIDGDRVDQGRCQEWNQKIGFTRNSFNI